MKQIIEYRARFIDTTGYSYECFWFTGDLGEYHAMKYATRHVSFGGTALVERVVWSLDNEGQDEVQPRTYTLVWSGKGGTA